MIDKHNAHAIAFDHIVVEREFHMRDFRRDICGRRSEISNLTQFLLGCSGIFHDGGIVSGSRHDVETVAFAGYFNFRHIEIERFPGAHHFSQRMGLVGLRKVRAQQVRGTGGEGHQRNARVGKFVAYRGDRAIAAAYDNSVEIACIVQKRA